MSVTKVKRIGIDASAMLIARKNGYENYTTNLILAMSELDPAEFEGLDIYLYFYAGNRLADATLLDTLLPRLQRFTCRVYRLRRGFRVALPMMVMADRLDGLHLPVYIWNKRFPCPIVSTFHDACSKRMALQGYTSDAIEQLEQSTQMQLAISRKLIAVSQSSKQDLIDLYGVSPDRIQVIHHGIDERFKPDPNAASRVRQKYALSNYILSVNALQGNKNYVRLLRAFARLHLEHQVSQVLVLVGRDGWGCEEIYAEMRKLGLGSSVRHLGYVPQDDLIGLYTGADLVVNASLCEGFGLPLLEALACGAVVAAAKNPAFVEIGKDTVFYFDPYDINDIAATILDALTNSVERSKRLAVVSQHLARFTWKHAALETLSVYRTL